MNVEFVSFFFHLVLNAAMYTNPPFRGMGCLPKNNAGSILSGGQYTLCLISLGEWHSLLLMYLPLYMRLYTDLGMTVLKGLRPS